MDEAVPAWVKATYSPRESWKDKPFTKEDSRFFLKGVRELSDSFTEERARGVGEYFSHPKYRSSYLLYFLPLQAAKFVTLFSLHPEAMQRAVDQATKTGVMRVVDLGAGPGTASLALLLWLLDPSKFPGDIPFRVEFRWSDFNRAIMEDGKALVEKLSSHFPKLRGKVEVRAEVGPWWKLAESLQDEAQLAFVGNVLNESPGGPMDFSNARFSELWGKMLSHFGGGGTLFVEPAIRRASQTLSRLRDELLERKLLSPEGGALWGPCLHAGMCPLAQGRDWCHFSVPAQVPGQWFREFSKGLGSERNWLKFAYLWLASPKDPAPVPKTTLRRVISDPLGKDRSPGASQEVLICEPDRPDKVRVGSGVRRGDIIGQ
ncbi:MAG TPA: small ribosomal subunit Rsm22 family protein [Bdellovibrionota bacterium]|nr:small ribosomal subunit Rsm22 family protein [Bdellovibrionota bacterium]